VLVGDAAFVARPHVATGVSKAALDVQCLADALAQHDGDIDAALARYAEERGQVGQRLVGRGRHLGAWIKPPAAVAHADSSASERASRIGMLLHEYGAAGVVGDSAARST
jgi:2-polyprenyl-6-methoxyphenol hydroxylase-like FAD-dependent oxidoreductase